MGAEILDRPCLGAAHEPESVRIMFGPRSKSLANAESERRGTCHAPNPILTVKGGCHLGPSLINTKAFEEHGPVTRRWRASKVPFLNDKRYELIGTSKLIMKTIEGKSQSASTHVDPRFGLYWDFPSPKLGRKL
ncbi:hypothetical protein CRG98_050092 [Punica granatum]|uniref:Uncharacterized protein n=1 Tax=Punica granatum TaxID=22663 RepID=A0A2I0GTV3_PUNGR|nr:hypothetical protein CRG98_050092 [Punica granatum]